MGVTGWLDRSGRDPSLIMWNRGSIMWNPSDAGQEAAEARWRAPAPRPSTAPPCSSSTVVQADEPLTFADLQEACDLPKSTTSRMLTALERSDLLERTDDGSYVAGGLFWLYAARHDPGEDLVRLAGPMLEAIGEETHETVQPQPGPRRARRPGRPGRLAVPARHPRLDRGRRARALLVARQGLPAPGTLSSCRRARWRRRPTTSLADRAALRADVERTRSRGWAITVDELEVGLTGIAVPVRGPRGQVVAALGVSGPTPRLEDRFDELGRLLTTPRRGADRAAPRHHGTTDHQGGRGMTQSRRSPARASTTRRWSATRRACSS